MSRRGGGIAFFDFRMARCTGVSRGAGSEFARAIAFRNNRGVDRRCRPRIQHQQLANRFLSRCVAVEYRRRRLYGPRIL